MKAISIKQPFAYYIALGQKPIEIRSWATSYRGPLLICSSQKPYTGNIVIESAGKAGLVPASFQMSMSTHFKISNEGQEGCAICVVDLVDCRLMQNTIAEQLAAKVEYRVGHFAWEFENVRKIEKPFRVKGKLGFFEVDDSLIPEEILNSL